MFTRNELIEFAKQVEKSVYNDDVVHELIERAPWHGIIFTAMEALTLDEIEEKDPACLWLRVPNTSNEPHEDRTCRANYIYLERNKDYYPGMEFIHGGAYVPLTKIETDAQKRQILRDFPGMESSYPLFSDDIYAELEAEDGVDY